MELGVASAMMSALKANSMHQGVQQWGLMSVGNLCNASEHRKCVLMDLGLGQVLVQVGVP